MTLLKQALRMIRIDLREAIRYNQHNQMVVLEYMETVLLKQQPNYNPFINHVEGKCLDCKAENQMLNYCGHCGKRLK